MSDKRCQSRLEHREKNLQRRLATDDSRKIGKISREGSNGERDDIKISSDDARC